MRRLLLVITCFQIFCFFLFFFYIHETAGGDAAPAAQVLLSPEEKQWLTEHPNIKMAIRDNPPLMMRGESIASFHGLSIDYVHLIEHRLGINFRMVYYATQKDQFDGARKREVDTAAAFVWSPDRLGEFNFTPPYIVLENKIVARTGFLAGPTNLERMGGKRVAVVHGTALEKYLEKYQGLLTIVPMPDEQTILQETSFGAVDAAIIDMARASYYIQEAKINNLTVVGSVDFSYKFCFASRKDWPILNSILSKALASITQEEREAIFRKWIYPDSPAILKTGTFWLAVTGSGMIVFTIMILFWNRTLRRRVEKSNAELSVVNEQLRQSQKMEAVGQLAGGIAHDFNNILMAIIGYADLLRMKTKEDAPIRAYAEHILEAADRAAHLTHELLAFSRRQILNPQPLDLNEIISRLKTLLRRGIGENIELKTVFSKETMVYVDRAQIELVLINLANNARDAMPQGGILTIETETIALDNTFRRIHGFGDPGMYVLVSVTDTGMGMDEKTRMRIFEPFFTTKEVGKGTGLGLSMVYGVIKQHQGYISVESTPGKGTKFTIYLPLLPLVSDRQSLSSIAAEETFPGGTETLLLAEDDEVLRKLSRSLLEEAGYKVIEAKNGEDAIEEFLGHKDEIKMLIFDMIMPRKGGMEAFKEIKIIKPDIKAIFVSGYTADKLYMDRMLRGESELIFKPISPGTLLKKVREILDK
jgi:signal transduction histidine kinase